MGYLFLQILLCLLLAFLLGLLLGWLLWVRHRAAAADPECARDLAAARRRLAALEADLAAANAAPAPVAAAAGGTGGAVGLFGTPAERPVDDLKRIDGIGPVIETQLAGIGVTTFRQIARFTADDVQRVNDAIKVFQGRIEREEWIAQAARLHREDYGDDA